MIPDRYEVARMVRMDLMRCLLDHGPMRMSDARRVLGWTSQKIDHVIRWLREARLADDHPKTALTARGLFVATGLIPVPPGKPYETARHADARWKR